VDTFAIAQPARWDFLTNHAHVLISIATRSPVRIRDIAEQVGITERATQRIVHDLVAAGYIERHRVGRRNEYTIHASQPLRHPLQQDYEVGGLLALFCQDQTAEAEIRSAVDGRPPRVGAAGLRRESARQRHDHGIPV